mgnify:CR=1 FL=1
MAEKSSCRCSSSYSLMRSCNASFKLSLFFSPSLARMFARWLVMFPLLRCNNSHIWLTVLSCSIKRQMFNSDGIIGYILLIVSSLLFSFFWYAARAVKDFLWIVPLLCLTGSLSFLPGYSRLTTRRTRIVLLFHLETFQKHFLFLF